MKQNYQILVKAFASVVVIGAESEDEALRFATDEISYGDFQMDEASSEGVVTDENLESAKRDADFVAEEET